MARRQCGNFVYRAVTRSPMYWHADITWHHWDNRALGLVLERRRPNLPAKELLHLARTEFPCV